MKPGERFELGPVMSASELWGHVDKATGREVTKLVLVGVTADNFLFTYGVERWNRSMSPAESQAFLREALELLDEEV